MVPRVRCRLDLVQPDANASEYPSQATITATIASAALESVVAGYMIENALKPAR
jgi:hypothetical protein